MSPGARGLAGGGREAAVRAAVIVTGTEVLTGRVTDRNGPWISEQLGALGVDVAQIMCVGDRHEDLMGALRFCAAERLDLVITTGGLGPTADDLTAEVVADFTGRPLELDAGMEAKIGQIIASFARRLRLDPDAIRAANRKQAMVPRGALAIDPAGTAPGLVVPPGNGEPTIVVLPGPPRELQAMWPAALECEPVRDALRPARPYRTSSMRLFGIPESELAGTLSSLAHEVDLGPLEITTCLRSFELEIDVRHAPADEPIAERLMARVREEHSDHVFSEDGSTVDDQVAELLSGRRLAVAESCTGGLLSARITARPGSSEYFSGGVVAYSDEAKRELLAVPEGLIAEHGAVSTPVAEAMARGALERFGADVAAAITGVAGPGGGTEHKPVGYVCISAIDSAGRSISRDPALPGRRQDVRERSETLAMHLLRRLLLDEHLD